MAVRWFIIVLGLLIQIDNKLTTAVNWFIIVLGLLIQHHKSYSLLQNEILPSPLKKLKCQKYFQVLLAPHWQKLTVTTDWQLPSGEQLSWTLPFMGQKRSRIVTDFIFVFSGFWRGFSPQICPARERGFRRGRGEFSLLSLAGGRPALGRSAGKDPEIVGGAANLL